MTQIIAAILTEKLYKLNILNLLITVNVLVILVTEVLLDSLCAKDMHSS